MQCEKPKVEEKKKEQLQTNKPKNKQKQNKKLKDYYNCQDTY